CRSRERADSVPRVRARAHQRAGGRVARARHRLGVLDRLHPGRRVRARRAQPDQAVVWRGARAGARRRGPGGRRSRGRDTVALDGCRHRERTRSEQFVDRAGRRRRRVVALTMRDLRGKVAVITGGASGMGRAFADRFATEGMKIVFADIESDALARAVDELRTAGADVTGLRTDVASLADVEEIRDHALDAFGGVHVVCNNAGVAGGAVVDAPIELWRWVVGINLWGVIHGCHVLLPLLLEQDEGHIVNTASLAGFVGSAGLGIY